MAEPIEQHHPTGTPRTFLIVDDDEVFRTRLLKALHTRGLEASWAADATQALEVAQHFEPEAAIVDLRMPGMSGLDLIPHQGQVVITAWSSNSPVAICPHFKRSARRPTLMAYECAQL